VAHKFRCWVSYLARELQVAHLEAAHDGRPYGGEERRGTWWWVLVLEKSTSMMGRRGSLNNGLLIGRRGQDLGHGRSNGPGFYSPSNLRTIDHG
jgi:hypothetical protein